MITVYTKKVCPQCIQMKHYLTRHGVAFETIDIEEDMAAMAHVTDLGFKQVPITELGAVRVSGFVPLDPVFREILATAKAAS